jgi:hypothetical protein
MIRSRHLLGVQFMGHASLSFNYLSANAFGSPVMNNPGLTPTCPPHPGSAQS